MSETELFCRHCHIGRGRSTKLPYLHPVGEQVIVIPNVPAAQCDVCGHTRFERGVLNYLDYILDQLTAPRPEAPVVRHAVSGKPTGWHSGRGSG